MLPVFYSFFALLAVPLAVQSIAVTDIQGIAWLSPYNGQTIHNLTGIVTAKGPDGVYIAGNVTSDQRASSGLYVYGSSIVSKVHVGDLISLTGKVSEYRSSSYPDYLFGTELTSPSSIVVLSSNNTVTPVLLGTDRSPPTELLSALDTGPDGWLSVPNNQSRISVTNATLNPALYGLDFWESLEGQLVTMKNPVAIDFENEYGEFWVRGDWPVTNQNARGGLTIVPDANGIPDGNPETIIIGSPLDGTKNSPTALGMTFTDVTGVVTYQFGYFYVLPTTAPSIVTTPTYNPPPVSFTPSSDPCSITIGDYNVENMAPTDPDIPAVATHIAKYLNSPYIMFLQEIQDNSGETDDGTVNATQTLTNLVAAITTAGGANYSFIDIDPINDQDGGVPGGNIRPAYLYRADKVSLVPGSSVGTSTEANQVVVDSQGNVGLLYNPGLIDPANTAWNSSRKPIAANWQTPTGERFFTVDVHFTSKDGSSTFAGDARPPVNEGVDQRTQQVTAVGTFVQSILAKDASASVIVAGDHNEYTETRSVFAGYANVLQDADVVANIPPVERYTYNFDQNCEQLDHIFVSNSVAQRGLQYAHIHVNTWSPSYNARISDHDPSAIQLLICSNLQEYTGSTGGIAAPPVTARNGKYVVDGKTFPSLALARGDSCTVQGVSCAEYARDESSAAIGLTCAKQLADCLLKIV